MRNFLVKKKDGGKDSPVEAYFLFEIKGLCSVALLKFNKGCRETYHTHAFNAYTWFLKGDMQEQSLNSKNGLYKLSLKPKFTSKEKLHRVVAYKDSWCLTLRGKWDNTWKEYDAENKIESVLTHGRKVLSTEGEQNDNDTEIK